MKDLKARLKTVQELLTNAEFIRTHAEPSAAGEANDWELLLAQRQVELEKQIAAEKKKEPVLAHAE